MILINNYGIDSTYKQISSILKMIDNPKSLDKGRWRTFGPVFDAWSPSDLFPALDILRHVSAAAHLDSETAKELLAYCYNLLSPTTRDFDLVTCYIKRKAPLKKTG